MRSGPAAGRPGFLHELLVHSSADELLETVVPFLEDGTAAGEPTFAFVRPETAAMLSDHVPPSPHVTFLPADGHPSRPAVDLRTFQSVLASYGDDVPQVRLVHEEPPVDQVDWPEWRRLEAVANVAFDVRDAWGLCVYDQARLTDEMVADLHGTHHFVARGRDHVANDRYEDPASFVAARRAVPPHPVETTAPTTEVVDPSPLAARAAVSWTASQTPLPRAELDKLVFVANEAVTNALVHGCPPVTVRVWALDDGVTVTVTDTGDGPSDPFIGFLKAEDAPGLGMGMWLGHQLVDVAHRHHEGGYTVRLTARRP